MTTDEILEKMEQLTPENRIKFHLYLEWLANTQDMNEPIPVSLSSANPE